MRRGITIINEAEGAYKHDKQTVLMTIVTRYELPLLREAMKASDPQAFVSIAENVRYLVVSMRMAFRSSLTKFMKYCCRQTFVCLQFSTIVESAKKNCFLFEIFLKLKKACLFLNLWDDRKK